MRLSWIALFVLLVGCGEAPLPEPPPVAAAARGGEGLCAQHGVLESVCPQCHPKLAAIFQAKGDWCRAHGFPESFCPVCHPERDGRPGAALVQSDGPADGTLVQLDSAETARAAGIETAARSEEHTSELQSLRHIV